MPNENARMFDKTGRYQISEAEMRQWRQLVDGGGWALIKNLLERNGGRALGLLATTDPNNISRIAALQKQVSFINEFIHNVEMLGKDRPSSAGKE